MSHDLPPRGSGPAIPTKAELLRLIADRENDPSVAELKHTPRWMLDAEDPVRRHIRRRERRNRYVTTRLDKATRAMEQEWDHNV